MKKLLLVVLISLSVFPLYSQEEKVDEKPCFMKNNVSFFLSDVVMKRFSFEYEHVMGDKGNMSINIPASYSFGEVRGENGGTVNWWVGMGLKLYPTGQGVIRYFVGPEVRIISIKEAYYDYVYDASTNTTTSSNDDSSVQTAFLLNNGMIYEPVKQFVFTVSMGVGIRTSDHSSSITALITPSVRMGIRF